ncbi:MAG: competence protein [Roseobacter sp. MedPE-SWchi]|nr:MAG: competence protein [Roseobacter sp. MedPE-SWchi]
MQILQRMDRILQRQRGHLMPWIPVCLGVGIGLFFLRHNDPSFWTWTGLALTIVAMLSLTVAADARALLAWGAILICLGFLVAGVRCALVQAPVLDFRYYGPVEGRLIAVGRTGNGAVRLTLDRLRLSRLSPKDHPARARLSLAPGFAEELPELGARIATTAHLMPPQGPSEPGGFDYRRYAWFQRIGANGYTRVPLVVLQPAQSELFLSRFRHRLSHKVRHRLGPSTGGFAAAIIAGDRSSVGAEDLKALRASNLAHLLAISGLHMGLLTGFVFAALRFTLCFIPALALRWNIKKISAGAALAVGFLYLCISGGNVATERAFIMVLVLFVAVLLDRRALTLRAVAVAATLVLLRRPETLLSPGFQMSFAATTALVAVFGWIRNQDHRLGPPWLRPVLTVVISSAVAGVSTAPFGAAHFHLLSHYGLIGNVLAVPIMGLVVVPAAVLSLLLATIGAEQIGIFFLNIGLEWILFVATWVSSFPNAQSGVVMPGPVVLPLLALGALFTLLWRGRARWLGLLLVSFALFNWAQTQRPLLLISGDGGLVGVLQPQGRALSRKGSQAYTARNWLAADGSLAGQIEAARLWEEFDKRGGIQVAGFRVLHITGKRQAEGLTACQAGDLVISNKALRPTGGCRVVGPDQLRQTGAIAMDQNGEILTVALQAGNRPWSRP